MTNNLQHRDQQLLLESRLHDLFSVIAAVWNNDTNILGGVVDKMTMPSFSKTVHTLDLLARGRLYQSNQSSSSSLSLSYHLPYLFPTFTSVTNKSFFQEKLREQTLPVAKNWRSLNDGFQFSLAAQLRLVQPYCFICRIPSIDAC